MQTTRPENPSRLGRLAVACVWLAAAAGTIAFMLIAAAVAEGGTYRVSQCNPRHDAARGDLAFERNSDHYTSSSACLEGHGLVIRHDARRTGRDRWGAWSLRAPQGTVVRGIRARVGGAAAAGHEPELFAGAEPSTATAFGRATGGPHSVRWRGQRGDGFAARLRCARAACGEGRNARLALRNLDLRLFESAAPRVDPLGAAHRGTHEARQPGVRRPRSPTRARACAASSWR